MKLSLQLFRRADVMPRITSPLRRWLRETPAITVEALGVGIAIGAAISLLVCSPSAFASPSAEEDVTTHANTQALQQHSSDSSQLPQRLVWDKRPIHIALDVGVDKEKLITFPAQVFLGIPAEVAALLRVQTVDRTAYITALAPFPATRVIAEDRNSGDVFLLDLSAAPGAGAAGPVEIFLPKPAVSEVSRSGVPTKPPIDYVTLTRFAAKQLYAPLRLTADMDGIRRVSVPDKPVTGLYRGELVHATPIGAWRADDLYVTAVKIQNMGSHAVEFNPLQVVGSWKAITFQHGRVLPRGNEADTTAVYLVCDRPFNECR